MAAVSDLLTDLGVAPRIAQASAQWLRQLAAEQAADGAPADPPTVVAGGG